MEPMTLGSPTNGPTISPSFGHYPQGNSLGNVAATNSYYPSYLMGDTQTSLSSRIPPGSISPGRPARPFPSSNAMSSPISPQVHKDNFYPTPRIGGERQGGPPILSLMGGGQMQSPSARMHSTAAAATSFIDQQRISTPGNISNIQAQTGIFTTPIGSSTLINQSLTPYTPTREYFHGTCSETHVESQLAEPLEDSWVTVYGFPVASASYILTQFAQLGIIVDQRQPGLGNWMHLKYQTKLQARKALAKNSKIFSGNIMVGVVPCTDKTIIGEKENISLNTSSVFSPREANLSSSTPKKHIRPLTQAYQASRVDMEVAPKINTPQKSEGLVSKAIQHILGV